MDQRVQEPPLLKASSGKAFLANFQMVPLSTGKLNVNVDTALSPERIGIISRDHPGSYSSNRKSFLANPTAFLGECIAFREGLILTLHLGLVLEKAETDVQNVVFAITKNSTLAL
ncbi:hypothetical protein PanWU01x14_210140 [Parasponia andersonii]|uniref:RNase H type-1 domain-containing protein n=1 Tax=Parasponia andersonii TaxID=3476 RepID=A0A2P5BU47_PARAD|nr:hypothetical protein PanWU01x14_210140 [Parasponia andersonii]